MSREALREADPEAISGYRLIARLGQGGMGVVYLGESPEGRQVAVKVIRQHLATNEDFRARFRAEVATAGKVARFCTAPILDADTTADAPYIVTEYIDGPTLGEVVEEHGSLPGAQLHALGVGVASALGAIHRAGIMHRDLKPSNVMLSQFGPMVIDFGIARAIDAVTSITQPGRMMGSPSYMAPEQLRGDTLTQRVDIFAWGAIMVYAGTGRQPFTATGDAVYYQVMYGEPDLTGLDPQLTDVVAWALRKEPAERPTAEQLLEALVGSGEDATGSPAGVMPVPPAPAERGDQRAVEPAADRSPDRAGRHSSASTRGAHHQRTRTRRSQRVRWGIAALGALLGVLVSLGTVTYLDYDDARTQAVAALRAYLQDIHEEDYPSAYNRLCSELRSEVTGPEFGEGIQASPGVESFVVESSVPFRFTAPYAVTVRITEKNGNAHTSVFDVQKDTAGGRDVYLVCRLRQV